MCEFPAEEVNSLQQQQTDRQEEQRATQPERKAVCLFVCECDSLSQEEGQMSPGATQHLHARSRGEERRGEAVRTDVTQTSENMSCLSSCSKTKSQLFSVLASFKSLMTPKT